VAIDPLLYLVPYSLYVPAFKFDHISLHSELHMDTSESAQIHFLIVKIRVALKSDKNNGYCT